MRYQPRVTGCGNKCLNAHHRTNCIRGASAAIRAHSPISCDNPKSAILSTGTSSGRFGLNFSSRFSGLMSLQQCEQQQYRKDSGMCGTLAHVDGDSILSPPTSVFPNTSAHHHQQQQQRRRCHLWPATERYRTHLWMMPLACRYARPWTTTLKALRIDASEYAPCLISRSNSSPPALTRRVVGAIADGKQTGHCGPCKSLLMRCDAQGRPACNQSSVISSCLRLLQPHHEPAYLRSTNRS